MRVSEHGGVGGEVRSIRMEPTIALHNIGNHKVESKSNAIGRGRSHCYALLSFPSPVETLEWRISSSEFTIGTALLFDDTDNSYSYKYNILSLARDIAY